MEIHNDICYSQNRERRILLWILFMGRWHAEYGAGYMNFGEVDINSH